MSLRWERCWREEQTREVFLNHFSTSQGQDSSIQQESLLINYRQNRTQGQDPSLKLQSFLSNPRLQGQDSSLHTDYTLNGLIDVVQMKHQDVSVLSLGCDLSRYICINAGIHLLIEFESGFEFKRHSLWQFNECVWRCADAG